MKSFSIFLLILCFVNIQSFADCYINTDTGDHPDIVNPKRTWHFLLQNDSYGSLLTLFFAKKEI